MRREFKTMKIFFSYFFLERGETREEKMIRRNFIIRSTLKQFLKTTEDDYNTPTYP